MDFSNSPVVIGAIGGSGTRVFARIARHAGFFMGASLNKPEDSEPFIDFYNAWIPLYLQKEECLPEPVQKVLEDDFHKCLKQHLLGQNISDLQWGIKNPKSIHMIKFWNQMFPQMKFIQIVRNGLDVAYSSNQGQFQCYKDLVFNRKEQDLFGKAGAVLFWSRVNQLAADFGETHMKGRYLRIRFEELCTEPKRVVTQIFDFLEVSDSSKLADAIAEVSYPSAIGRWRTGSVNEIYEIMKVGKTGLEHYNYWNSLAWKKIEYAMHLPRLQRLIFQHTKMKNLPAW